jgi:hypothetical protein
MLKAGIHIIQRLLSLAKAQRPPRVSGPIFPQKSSRPQRLRRTGEPPVCPSCTVPTESLSFPHGSGGNPQDTNVINGPPQPGVASKSLQVKLWDVPEANLVKFLGTRLGGAQCRRSREFPLSEAQRAEFREFERSERPRSGQKVHTESETEYPTTSQGNFAPGTSG